MKKLLFFLLVLTGMVQKAWADTTVTTEDALKSAVQTSQTVTLGQDITLTTTGRLDIDGTTVTLDLNGHTLKRPMAAADAGGQVIAVMNSGSLTISDSSGDNSGKITGGWAYQGGAIYVYEGCSLTINGGTITGNRSDQISEGGYGYGGGVENHGTMTMTGGKITGNTAGQFGGGIHNEGTLTITGGTITDNNAGTYGGAIYSNSTVSISGVTISGNTAQTGGGAICTEGTLTLDGVTISGNSAQNGGGIYMFGTGTVQLKGESTITGNTAQTGGGIFQVTNGNADGPTLKMQDKPVVKDNTNDNVHLQSYQFITVMGAFSEGARIGVSTEVEQSAFTSGYSTYNSGVEPSTYFFVSSHSIDGSIDWTSDNKEAKIAKTGYKYIDHTWDLDTQTLTAQEKTKANGEYTVLDNNSGWTALTDGGWFVVDGEIAIGALSVSGTSNLILCDGAKVTVTEGVKVESKSNAVLNIYGQAGNSGQLIATNSHGGAAGIGSGGSSEDGDAGRINIHGGTIHATGNKYAAGIGGGDNHGFDRTNVRGGLTVYGGNVTAKGGEYGAGIGSGDEPGTDNGAYCGYVTIYGGTVNAYGGKEAAGIGGGNEGHGAMFSIYGGNVTASGGPKGAGIGGGDEGDCNRVEIYGGTVTATSYSDTYYRDECAAAIGSGYGGRYCEVTINGGTVNAKADGQGPGIGRGDASSSYDENRKMFITITGGDVTATSNYYGAGIGSGAKTKFYGKIEISGGKVTATGHEGGAGIGTGATFNENGADMYGSIVISGGEVNARGDAETITDRGYVSGAGIGSGAAGQIKENARIEITGGNITAVSKSGGGIGAGSGKRQKTSDNPYQYSRVYCPISISGDNTTLRLMPGYILNEVSEAIRFGPVGSGSLSIDGTLNFNGQLAVSVNGTTCTANNRVSTLKSKSNVNVDPCTHSGATYTVSGITASDTHTKHCAYCGTVFEPETHIFIDGKCSVCGVEQDTYTVTVNVPANNGVTDGAYEAVIYKMVPGTTFKLPTSPITFDDRVFAGWLVGEAQNNTYRTSDGEELLAAGEEYTVNADVTFTARYSFIYITLADKADNSETIGKYAGKIATQVLLRYRTLYKDGSWNTLCLPFALSDFAGTPLAGATVKTLASATFDDGTLTLNFGEDLTAIEAGKPYIVKWASTQGSDNLVDPAFKRVTINNTSANVETDVVTFNGIFSPYTIESEDKTLLYLGAGNKLYYPDDAMTIGSCRAYFQLQGGLTAGDPATPNAISAFKLNFGDDESTGITTTNYTNSSDAWYTIDGQLLNGKPTQKGIYINNGKKVVISLKP